MKKPRKITLFNGYGFKYRKGKVWACSPTSWLVTLRSVNLSELKRLRDWLNNTIEYLEFTEDNSDQ